MRRGGFTKCLIKQRLRPPHVDPLHHIYESFQLPAGPLKYRSDPKWSYSFFFFFFAFPLYSVFFVPRRPSFRLVYRYNGIFVVYHTPRCFLPRVIQGVVTIFLRRISFPPFPRPHPPALFIRIYIVYNIEDTYLWVTRLVSGVYKKCSVYYNMR